MQANAISVPPEVTASRLRKLVAAGQLAASRLSAIALQTLLQIAIGASGGAAALGVFQLFQSWTTIAGETVARGQPARALRFTAVWLPAGHGGHIRQQLRHGLKRILLLAEFSAIILLLAGSLFYLLFPFESASSYTVLAWATLLAAPLFAFLRVFSDVIKAAGHPALSILVDSHLPALVLIMACIGAWLLNIPASTGLLLVAGVGGFALATAVAAYCVVRLTCTIKTPASAPTEIDFSDSAGLWLNSVLSIVFIHLPFILLPLYVDTATIGTYAVANKLVNIISALLLLQAAVFAPLFARAAASGDYEELRRLLFRTQCLSVVIFFPLALGLMFSLAPLTGLFNLPAGSLEPFIQVLLAAQLINAATGLPGVVLNMAGRAGREAQVLLAAVLLMLLASPLVASAFGAIGLAWLFGGGIVFKNIASFYCASRFIKHGKPS